MALAANITASLPTNYEYYTSGGINQGLNADESFFTLNDKLIRIYGGSMHYFRVPRVHWRDRLKKLRAAGLNAVETYVPWNLHEPEPGKYDFGNGGTDFEDFLHVEEFLNIAKEEDLFVILRPGPYICSEYNFGGFPSWLLRDKPMGFRTSEANYMKHVTRYFNVLLTLLAAFQFTQGGPIIAFQVENEYGYLSYGHHFTPDKVYLEQLRQLFLDHNITELLVTSDSPRLGKDKGTLPGLLLQTANMWDKPEAELYLLEELQPGRPLMVMEFWAGWFDLWGANHTTRTGKETIKYLDKVLERNASFNIYMFMGGTNFAFNSGARIDDGKFKTITTSYDYDAAISEYGNYTEKYYIIKDLVNATNPVKTYVPAMPEIVAPAVPEPAKIEKVLPFQKLIEYNAPYEIRSQQVVPMEKLDINNGFGQSNGYILYKKENLTLPAHSLLTIEGKVCDHALVLVNDKLIAPQRLDDPTDLEGFGYANLVNSTVVLNEEPIESATLEILVENMGRINVGAYNVYDNTFKGLWQGNVTINGTNIYDWLIVPLEFRKQWVNELKGWQNFSEAVDEPAVYSAVFNLDDASKDTFVDTNGWGKGLVFVNGFLLGRYAAVGPQRSLYLPSNLMQKGENRISFFEEFYVPEDGLVQFVDQLLFKSVK